VTYLCPATKRAGKTNYYLPSLQTNHDKSVKCVDCSLTLCALKLFSLEERQRAEKRNREAKNHKFTPRWFDLTEEVTPTPWGELEVYQYNGKYTEHRAAIDSSDIIEEPDSRPEFNPWQFDNLEAAE
jgi:hypothetical protein